MRKKSSLEQNRQDTDHVWHPYTNIESFEEQGGFPVMTRGKGVFLYDREGKAFYDGIASWWCVNLGHSHPRLVRAIQKQAGLLQQSILGSLSHEPVIRLSAELAKISPGNLQYAFYGSDGSSAVEIALKIAIQYWFNQGRSEKNQIIGLARGYHGDTLGAISAGYIPDFHRPFKEVLLKSRQAEAPVEIRPTFSFDPDEESPEAHEKRMNRSLENMAKLLREHHSRTAAFILEPLCQGAGGIRIYPERYLQEIRELCTRHEVLLIADEIATGFGRTGCRFACEKAGIVPDLLVLGKGITGGYLPLSVTLIPPEIYDAFRPEGNPGKTFFHGHTYGGNPLATALALETLRVYEDEKIIENLSPKIARLREGFKEIGRALEAPVRTLGMMARVRIPEEKGGAKKAGEIAQRAMEQGLFVRPLRDVLYLCPPLISTEKELDEMLRILGDSLEEK